MKHPLIAFIVLLLVSWLIVHLLPENVPEGFSGRTVSFYESTLQYQSPIYLPHVQVLADKIIELESEGEMVWGDLDKEYPAYGVGQFQKRTFYWLAELAGYDNMDWKDEFDQRKLLYWAIKNGYGEYWSTYDNALSQL